MLSVFAMGAALVAGVVAAGARGRWRFGAAAGAVGLWVLVGVALPHPAMVEKLATRLVLPAGLLWVAGYGAVVVCVARGRRRAAAGALWAWLAYAVAGSGQLGGALVAGLEVGFRPPAADARFDAVMVLGGGTDAGALGPQLSLAGDRLRVAAGLWHRGQAPVVVASGTSIGGLDQGEARDLGAEARAVLGELGVPARAVVTVPGPHNTATEVAALAAQARAAGWRRVGLVTSAWHLRRAMRLAERAGLPAVAIPADARGGVAPWTAVALVPTGNGFYQVGFAVKEWLGAALGR